MDNNLSENIYLDNNINDNNNFNNDEELVRAFIGPNYEKINNNIFNFSGFFFSYLYLFYRKLFLYGILLFLFTTVINVFIKNVFSGMVINAIIGLVFNKAYLYYVKNKILKVKNQNPNLNNEELKKICSIKGGTSIGRLFLGFFVEIVLAIIILVIAIMVGFSNTLGGFLGSFINSIRNAKNGVYDGAILYSTNVDIEKKFSVEVPSIFENHSNSYMYHYDYDSNRGVFRTCRLMFGQIDEFTNSADMINQMANYYHADNVNDEKINNINWHTFNYTNEMGTFYYYATNINQKTYLFDYSIFKDSDSDCLYYKDLILESVQSLK